MGTAKVRVVVDLDAYRRRLESEDLGHALQQFRLRRLFGHAPAERRLGVVQGVLDDVGLFTALRPVNHHLAIGAQRQSLAHQLGVGQVVRDKDQFRRRPVLVELPQKGIEDRPLVVLGIDAREIGAVAPVLAGAIKHALHAGITALGKDGEDVGLLVAQIDRRRHEDAVERPHPVAQVGGAFEVEIFGRLHHLPGQVVDDSARAPLEKVVRLLDQGIVVVERDDAGTRRRTALDLVQHARPGARLVDTVGAGTQQERLLQGVERAVHRARIGEGPEIVALDRVGAAVLGDLGRRMVLAHDDLGEHLVVAQQHIIARLQRLDQPRLEQ